MLYARRELVNSGPLTLTVCGSLLTKCVESCNVSMTQVRVDTNVWILAYCTSTEMLTARVWLYRVLRFEACKRAVDEYHL
jgi:hypothetical protein